MAYNREWDNGKDSWTDNDNSNWDQSGYGNDSYSRDDDYYVEGKRRKFNNGGYQGQGYDASQYYEEPYDKGYQHRNNEYGQDDRGPRGGSGGGGGGGAGGASGAFGKKRTIPSEPTPHVIFLGLDPDFTEADLQAYLASNGCSIETVTIIRERSSGVSKGFGFAQFASTEHARAFVDPLFPFIQIPPPASHGASATAAFYKDLETGNFRNGRRVKIDYSQSASPHEKSRFNRGNLNDGTRDIGSAPAPVLLFRGLDPLSGPQAIHQAMLSSSGPGKPGAKGMKRIILVKDKVTMASFGFAFVEFVDVSFASAVLAATMSVQTHPSGFRISDRPVAASFAHPYSFQPVTDFLSRDESCLMSSKSLGGVEDTWVRYWDETSTVAVLEFKVEEPVQTAVSSNKEKEKKKKVKEVDVRHVPAPSELPISDKPVTLSFSKGGKPSTAAGPVKQPITFGISLDDTGENDEDEESAANASKVAAFKKVAPLIASKKTVNNINKWNQVQEELTQGSDIPIAVALAARKTSPVPSASATPPAVQVPKPAAEATPPADTEFEYADVAGLMCLLCARQFKSLDQLKRHNKESDLHKKNYKDPNLREVAKQKVLARQKAAEEAQQPKYRDRASERRVLFNQPDAPVPEKDTSKPGKRKHAEGPPPPPSPPPPPVHPGKDENNVGNKLLKMMGWKEGTGLGTDGDGRVDPIQTAIYAQGVGLGASKGKEVGKYAEGYTGYVHMAQDAARERYGS